MIGSKKIAAPEITGRNHHFIFLFVSALVLSCAFLVLSLRLVPANQAHAAQDSDSTRAIAIAYDNSGSMTEGSRWSKAQYSIEVLAAMMDPDDTLAIFAMGSSDPKLVLEREKNSSKRATAVHEKDLGYSKNTNPQAVSDAHQWLLSRDEPEKYLVITTDGEFNVGGGLGAVNRDIASASDEGITVIYLAIGDNADCPPDDLASGAGEFRVFRASNDEILSQMTSITNFIFKRASLGALQSNNINLEVPMGKLIVFAQGDGVTVGEMTDSNGKTIAPSVVDVAYRDHMTDSPSMAEELGSMDYGNYPDTNLQGVVATFEGEIPKGGIQLDVDGAETFEIYYQPRVSIAVSLDGDRHYELTGGERKTIRNGTYQVSHSFIDPDTGQKLDSWILDSASFELTVKGPGEEGTRVDDEVTIDSGKYVFDAEARVADAGVHQTLRVTGETLGQSLMRHIGYIIALLLILALLLWVFGAGRISRSIWNNVTLEGWKAPVTVLGSKPRRIGGNIGGLITNKWRWEGSCRAPISVLPASKAIVLNGKYFKFGKEAVFENYDQWRAKGWKLSGKGNGKGSERKIRKGTRMTHPAGYTIKFG